MSNAAFWDKIAPKYATDPISDLPAYEKTLGRMRHYLQPESKVLELGCGTGSTALELAPAVAEYVGTDVSPKMIEIARAKLTAQTPAHLRFETGEAGALPKGGFDTILALNLLHLVDDLEGVLAAIYDALPSGGLLIDKTALLREGKWYLGLAIPVMRALGKAPFVRSLGLQEYQALLTAAGFEQVEQSVQAGMAPRAFTVSRKP